MTAGGPSERTGGAWVDGAGKVTLLYAAALVLLAYPLSVHPASTTLPGDPDTNLFMWTLAWDLHALFSDPFRIFEANIYYPQGLTLAYSENLIGSALLAAPVLWSTGNHVLTLNVVALVSTLLCGVGASVLARRIGIGPLGAVICGFIFLASPPRFFRIGQIHLVAMQWLPFGLAFLHSYLDRGRARDLRWACAFLTLQVLASGHGASYFLLAAGLLLVYRVALGEPIAPWRRLRDLGVVGALLLLPIPLVFVPYRLVQLEVNLRRTLADWEVSRESFLASPSIVHTWILSLFPDAGILESADAFLFPGVLPLLLAGVALMAVVRVSPRPADDGSPTRVWTWTAGFLELVVVLGGGLGVWVLLFGPLRWVVGNAVWLSAREPWRALAVAALAAAGRYALRSRVPFTPGPLARWWTGWRRWAETRRRDMRTFYALLTAASLWLFVGSPVGIWPLVHSWPGLNFIRVPSRFSIVTLLGVAVLAGFGFERLVSRFTPRRRALLTGLALVLLAAELISVPLPVVPYQVEIPDVDRWLDDRPKPFVVAEMPGLKSDRLESTYMLHSMAHWQKTIHGHSGFRVQLHVDLFEQLRLFPTDETIQSLRDLGVTYIVVHEDYYPPGEWPDVAQRLEQFADDLTLVHTAGAGRVYTLRP